MYQNMYNTPAPQQQINPYEQNNRYLKSLFSKPLFLIICVLSFVSVVFTFINSASVNPSALIDSILGDSRFYMSTHDYISLVDTMESLFLIIVISFSLYSLAICLSYALLYFKSKNDSPSSNPKSGATILWVVSIIGLIFICIAAILFIFVSIGLFVSASQSIYSESYTISAVISLIFALAILFYGIAKLIFFSSVRSSFINLELSSKGSIAYGVFMIIITVISFFSTISLLSNETFSFMSVISSLISAVNNLLIIVFAFTFNSYVKKAKLNPWGMNNINSQPSGNPPFFPQGQGGNVSPMNGNYQQNPQGNPHQAPNMNMGYTYKQQIPNQMPMQNPNDSHSFKNEPLQQPKMQFNNPNSANSTVKTNNQPQKNGQVDLDKTCPVCGAAHGNNDVFCGNCGARVK